MTLLASPAHWLARTALAAGIVAMSPAAFRAPALAHPHVFVTTNATVVIENGAISAIDHVWTFDEFYTAMAIEGLDTNKDGKYSREELAELAKTNMEGLKEFQYFTYPKLEKSDLRLADPKDYYLEHNNGVLSLHFRLPLEKPVLTDAKGFNFTVADPSFFIAFEMAKSDPVKLSAGAPKACKVSLGDQNDANPDAKRLNDAFSGQFGQAPSFLGGAKTATVDCAAS